MKRTGKTLALLAFSIGAGTAGRHCLPAQPTRSHAYAVRRPRQVSSTIQRQNTATTPYDSDFDKIAATVEKRFYDPAMHNVDWNKTREKYRSRLTGVQNQAQFAVLVNAMLAELHASHLAYVTDQDSEYSMLNAVRSQDMQHGAIEHIGVTGERRGAEYHVLAVLNDGPAAKAGIQAGDVLVTADGQPFFSAASFTGKSGSKVTVELRREGEADLRAVSVSPIKQNVLRSYLEATERSAKVIPVGDKKIGYVHLWTMAQDAFRATLESLVENKLHDTDGLILDLRDGYGGHPFGYADVFFRPDVSWESQQRGQKAIVQHTGYGKPIVALINGGTRSAKEFFAYEMRSSRRATLVGTPTAGAFIGAGFVPIGSSGVLEIAELGLKVDGIRLENNGVRPDVLVEARNIYTDQDAQLNRAKEILVRGLPAPGADADRRAVITVH